MRSSVWEQYVARTCWICMDDQMRNSAWDLWVQCGHIYCQRCSEQLICRQMACPLCRTKCNSVLRSPATGNTLMRQLSRPLLPPVPHATM